MEYILELLKQIRPDENFGHSTDFIEDYLLDSLDIMTLTAELESHYGISIDTIKIVPENFKSTEAIAKMVQSCGGSL